MGRMASLRGWNARCLARITERSFWEETVDPSFDLVANLRAQRLRWLGHVLRMEESRWIRRTVTQMHNYDGSIFMDAPAHTGMPDLMRKQQIERHGGQQLMW